VIRLSEPAREHTSVIRNCFATIVTIVFVLAIANQDLPSVLNTIKALRKTWYVLSKFHRNGAVEAAKHPTTTSTFFTTVTVFVLPAAAGRN
jgi:hypothetical protein